MCQWHVERHTDDDDDLHLHGDRAGREHAGDGDRHGESRAAHRRLVHREPDDDYRGPVGDLGLERGHQRDHLFDQQRRRHGVVWQWDGDRHTRRDDDLHVYRDGAGREHAEDGDGHRQPAGSHHRSQPNVGSASGHVHRHRHGLHTWWLRGRNRDEKHDRRRRALFPSQWSIPAEHSPIRLVSYVFGGWDFYRVGEGQRDQRRQQPVKITVN